MIGVRKRQKCLLSPRFWSRTVIFFLNVHDYTRCIHCKKIREKLFPNILKQKIRARSGPMVGEGCSLLNGGVLLIGAKWAHNFRCGVFGANFFSSLKNPTHIEPCASEKANGSNYKNFWTGDTGREKFLHVSKSAKMAVLGPKWPFWGVFGRFLGRNNFFLGQKNFCSAGILNNREGRASNLRL